MFVAPPAPSAVFHVCFLLLLPQGNLRLPCQKALLNAFLTPISPSFKKRRGHSIGGVSEQRYQSIPVCVVARLPTWAQDVLVRRGWAKRTGCSYGDCGPQGWSEEEQEFSCYSLKWDSLSLL